MRFEAFGATSHGRSRTRRATSGAAGPLGGALRVRPDRVARHSARSVAPNRFSSRLRPGQPRFQRLCSSFPSPTVISPAQSLSAVSTVGAANGSSPGASILRVGLIYRAVPALALRTIRCCVPWQVPRPPRDLWRRQATRRRTPGPFRPRRPPLCAVRRTEPFLQPAAPRAAALTASVLVIPVADGHFSGQHFLRYLRWEPRTVLAPVPLL